MMKSARRTARNNRHVAKAPTVKTVLRFGTAGAAIGVLAAWVLFG